MKRLVLTAFLPLLTLPCASESSAETSAAVHISFKVKVPPVFKILQTTPIAGGREYRVWTNVKSILINDKEYRFTRVGETTLFVPFSNDALIVHGL